MKKLNKTTSFLSQCGILYDKKAKCFKMKKKKKQVIKIFAWLKECPVDYDEIEQTSDDDIITINFNGKNIYQKTLEKEV